MKRITTISFVIFTIFALSFSSLAQDGRSKLQEDGMIRTHPVYTGEVGNADDLSLTAGTSNSYTPENPQAVLYDQTTTPGGNGAPSQYFPDFLAAGEAADDFVVPPGEIWTIDSLLIVGTFSGVGAYTDLDVNIFADAGGLPGALLYSYLGIVANAGPTFNVPLSPAAILPEGTYWVNFMVNMDFTTNGQFFWSTSLAPVVNNEYAWRDTAGVFGIDTCTTYDWNYGPSLCGVGGGVDPDLQFALWGNVSAGGPLCIFMDDFNGSTNWTAVNLNDPCDWGYSTTPDIPGSSWGPPIFPATADSFYAFASSDACGSIMNVYLNGIFSLDLSNWQTVTLEFDSDMEVFLAPVPEDTGRVDISVDGGTSWTAVALYQADSGAVHEVVDISSIAGLQGDVRFRLCYYGDFSWHWAVDNFAVYVDGFIPVELTSFAASVKDGNVTLNWSTATETNNQGFEVQRSSNGNEFVKIGYVTGHGTVTETMNYVFTDSKVDAGSYSYRLKQLDFDGAYDYSNVIEVVVDVPAHFSLNQNYPNPFNPSTIIEFNLAVNSKVSLTVFDVLGQEVATLINGNLAAGSREITFDASALNSGVYFYRIDATGVDGTNFTSVKKMILTK